jgi:thymidylate kinase
VTSAASTDSDPAAAGGFASECETYQRALAGLDLPRFAPRPPAGPRIVALEGPNGAGKSTLCRLLSLTLGVPAQLGTDPAWFQEPLKTRMIRDADWYASAMFFMSGCCEQMRLQRVSRESAVLLDRSLWSTLAVHAAHGVERLTALVTMLRPVAGQLQTPDLTVVLEASLATCLARIACKTGPERALDQLTAQAAFHAREREFYRWLSRQVPGIVFVDANAGSPQEVAERARTLIRNVIEC